MNYNHIGELLDENREDVKREEILIAKIRKKFKCYNKSQMTHSMAKRIFYFLHENGITFKTGVGHSFLDEVASKLTVTERESISRSVINNKSKKKAAKTAKPLITGFVILALFTCIVYFGVYFYQDIKTMRATKKLAEIMSESFDAQSEVPHHETDTLLHTASQDTESRNYETEGPKEYTIQKKFEELQKINPDIAGWLTIDGMTIDYPVMTRMEDNHYYLKHNFEGEEDRNGLLILDYRCDQTADDQNMIIYGHNMKTGVMFGTLKKYKDKNFTEKHKYVSFQGLYEDMTFEVIAVMLSRVAYQDEDVFRYYDAIDISTMDNYLSFFNYVSDNAIYESGTQHDFGDTFLMLSTCDYTEKDGRLVVICKKCKQ